MFVFHISDLQNPIIKKMLIMAIKDFLLQTSLNYSVLNPC